MLLTIEDLYKGKATIIKGKEYLSTKELIKPFVDEMKKKTDKFRIKFKSPDQITFDEKQQDITFNRVCIEAVLPKEHDIMGYCEVVGLVYALDLKKPIVKLYNAYISEETGALVTFDPNKIVIQEVEPETGFELNIESLLEKPNNFKLSITELQKSVINDKKVEVGNWIDYVLADVYDNGFQNIKLSPQLIVKAYKDLFYNINSEHYIRANEEFTSDKAHKVLTQMISEDEKDILNIFEKSIMVSTMLGC